MHQSNRSILTGVACAICVSLMAGPAMAQEIVPAERHLTADQARGAFIAAGYLLHRTTNWEWMSPPVTTFDVHDSVNGRVLMVLVYPDATAALAGRVQADSRERALSVAGMAGMARNQAGPRIVLGYGPSVWNGNIAMVQTSQGRLDRLYQAQNECDVGMYLDSDVAREPDFDVAVDLDFQLALQDGTVNL